MEKLNINFASAVSEFEAIMKNFQIKKLVYKTIFRGKGLEFDGYRDFANDEDASMIDWKASLRANKLLAKQYIEERDIEIVFLIDVGNSMLFGSGNKLKAEYCAEVVVAMSHLVIGSNDRIGVVMFSDSEKKTLLPSKSRNQFNLLIDSLSNYGLYGGNFDLKSAINYLLKVARKHSIIIVASDFIGIKDCQREIRLLASRFETFALMIRDEMDEKIPDNGNQLLLQDYRSGRQILVDPSTFSQKYTEIAIKQKEAVKKMFNDEGIDMLELSTTRNFAIPLAAFLKARAGGKL